MQSEQYGQSDAYSLFVYAIRSQVTRDYYLRRLKIFFNYIDLLLIGTIEDRCNLFAAKAIEDPTWAFNLIIKFLQFQKERVEKEEITGATLRNFIKPIKLFCEMCDIPIVCKKITRGLPKFRKHADDGASTLEEIQKICEYPDRRINAIVYTMASSGIRLGAWDYLRWGHIKPIKSKDIVIAAKITVYAVGRMNPCTSWDQADMNPNHKMEYIIILHLGTLISCTLLTNILVKNNTTF